MIRQRAANNVQNNPLTVTAEYIQHGNLTYLWSWSPRRLPRSAATHAPLCNTVSTDKLSQLSKNSEFRQS